MTPEVIANLTALNLTGIENFGFGNASASSVMMEQDSSAGCKALPGDSAWPTDAIWSVLDLLLGGNALIKSVPVAAACYSEWDEYDPEECATITSQWNSPEFQYFPIHLVQHPGIWLANCEGRLNPPVSTGRSLKA